MNIPWGDTSFSEVMKELYRHYSIKRPSSVKRKKRGNSIISLPCRVNLLDYISSAVSVDLLGQFSMCWGGSRPCFSERAVILQATIDSRTFPRVFRCATGGQVAGAQQLDLNRWKSLLIAISILLAVTSPASFTMPREG